MVGSCVIAIILILLYRLWMVSSASQYAWMPSPSRNGDIYGIGRTTATQIVEATGIDPDTRCRDLTEDQVSKIRDYIEKNLNVEGDLRRDRAFDIKRLIEINCYRGMRHRQGLPVRGQTSKNNARTRKGPKKTIANKKK